MKNLIISKQIEKTEECSQIIKIANRKKVKVILVEAGQKFNIEKEISFTILWPDKNRLITENPLNNNSMVIKLTYGKVQMLFTGDIEQIAEKRMVEKYRENLKSTIIKIAHHGSKTSSTEEFINAVKPQIALIGVRRKE